MNTIRLAVSFNLNLDEHFGCIDDEIEDTINQIRLIDGVESVEVTVEEIILTR